MRRHRDYSNPITVFANIDKTLGYPQRQAGRHGVKPQRNECDPHAWVYDIDGNSDCSVAAGYECVVGPCRLRWVLAGRCSLVCRGGRGGGKSPGGRGSTGLSERASRKVGTPCVWSAHFR